MAQKPAVGPRVSCTRREQAFQADHGRSVGSVGLSHRQKPVPCDAVYVTACNEGVCIDQARDLLDGEAVAQRAQDKPRSLHVLVMIGDVTAASGSSTRKL